MTLYKLGNGGWFAQHFSSHVTRWAAMDSRIASHSYLNSHPDSPQRRAHFGGPTRRCIWRISAWLAVLCTAVRWGCSWWYKHRLAPLWNEAVFQELMGWIQGGLRHCRLLWNWRAHENTAYTGGTSVRTRSETDTSSKGLFWKTSHHISTACLEGLCRSVIFQRLN